MAVALSEGYRELSSAVGDELLAICTPRKVFPTAHPLFNPFRAEKYPLRINHRLHLWLLEFNRFAARL